MTWSRFTALQRMVMMVGVVVVGGSSVWVFQNRERLAAACLNTINGVTSKVAHLNEPFGIGATVQSKNPVVGIVPNFALTERSGRQGKNSELLGSYWVANFIFTRCATSCPISTAEFVRLQTDLPSEVLLVSFTVDPDHDSPEVLTAFAAEAGADPDRWLFLTGEKVALYKSVREGFHLAVEANSKPRPGWEVVHSPRFALVDPKGRIRGYYESDKPEENVRLREDIDRLLGNSPPAE